MFLLNSIILWLLRLIQAPGHRENGKKITGRKITWVNEGKREKVKGFTITVKAYVPVCTLDRIELKLKAKSSQEVGLLPATQVAIFKTLYLLPYLFLLIFLLCSLFSFLLVLILP